MQDYCQIPPFMSSVVPPNIFFTIDEDTSMGWVAYGSDGTGNQAGPESGSITV